MSKKAEIKITVVLDQYNIPQEIYWEASQSEEKGKHRCEALTLSMWDKEKRNSLMIDIWTPLMEIGEMNAHFYFTFMKLADTYERATGNDKIADKIRSFANDFAKSVGAAEDPD